MHNKDFEVTWALIYKLNTSLAKLSKIFTFFKNRGFYATTRFSFDGVNPLLTLLFFSKFTLI